MPTYTGDEIARKALREIGVLDPTEAGDAEILKDAREVGSDLIDAWRTEHLTVPCVTRGQFNLTNGSQTYTIGATAPVFTMDYPSDILAWSVVPVRAATNPVELPMGRPLTEDEWQRVLVKSQTGPYPIRMWFDKTWAAGLGNLLFHPIPNVATVAVVLYSLIPELTSLVANTQYNLRPGYAMAIITNLAIRLKNGRFERAQPRPGLEQDARRFFANIKRQNVRPRESPMRAEFSIGDGAGRRTFNIYTSSSR